MRFVALIFACAATCWAQNQGALAHNWQMRLAGIRLYTFQVSRLPVSYFGPQRFRQTISWQGVEDHETTFTYSRMGGSNIPLRLGHAVVASLMSLPEKGVTTVQSQPFRPVDRIAIRPDQLYYRYSEPWQPILSTLKNSARHNLSEEFGPDIKSLLRFLTFR